MSHDTVDVLYIEDDRVDVDLAHGILKEIGYTNFKLRVLEDGDLALKQIAKWDSSTSDAPPDLVLLDLNLPKINGKDVLKAIKASERLKAIPVIILSTSRNQVDVDETYRLGAAGFFRKPFDYDDYKNTFKTICEYWMNRALLPSKTPRTLPS